MSEPSNDPTPEPTPEPSTEPSTESSTEPDVGLISDEELPEDLRPSEDNPLAQDADESDGASPTLDAPGDQTP